MTRAARAAFRRLLVLQASWTYERMQGIGVGFASLPLLEPLRGEPARYRAAVARAVEYFNAHPYLAGVAVGAAARGELDGADGTEIRRLRTTLAGPLGALGDQLFWIGVVPAVVGALLLGVALGGGVLPVGVGLVLYLGVRLAITAWGLRLGLASGLDVGRVLKDSGLPDQVRRVGHLAGLTVGGAVPLLVAWYADAGLPAVWFAGMIGVGAGVGTGLLRRRIPTPRRVTLVVMGLLVLWHWGLG